MPRLLAMLFVLLGLFCAAGAASPCGGLRHGAGPPVPPAGAGAGVLGQSGRHARPDRADAGLHPHGEYNTTIWQLTAGVRDAGFESYVNSSDPELASLQNMNTVVLPNGESIDFGHLLASMNLV